MMVMVAICIAQLSVVMGSRMGMSNAMMEIHPTVIHVPLSARTPDVAMDTCGLVRRSVIWVKRTARLKMRIVE